MIKWLEKKRIFSTIFAILVAVEIFFFSSISGGPPAPGISGISMIYHFSVFFLLNFFLLVSLNGNRDIKISYLIIASIFSIIYSILDEAHQLFVPLRHPDLEDILTNNAGIFLSNLVYLYSKK